MYFPPEPPEPPKSPEQAAKEEKELGAKLDSMPHVPKGDPHETP